MEKKHPKWNYEEFLSFLLLYTAHADMDYSDEERDYILNRVDRVHYERIMEEFQHLNDYEILNIIDKYRGLYFPTNDRKQEILSNIEKLFAIDGEYSVVEKSMFRLLQRIL